MGGTLWWGIARSLGIVVESIHILRAAEWPSVPGWRDALAEPTWVESAKVLKADGESWVRRAKLMGRDVVVKCRALNTLSRRFKHAVGWGHAHKHWRGAELLAKSGIATGQPLLIGRALVDGIPCEVMVLEFVEGKPLLEILDEIARGVGPSVREQHAIARAIGLQLSKFGQKVYNRDHKPSNLVVTRVTRGEVEIAVIDCVGVKRPVMWRVPATIIRPLVIEPLGCGVLPRRALRARVISAYANAVSSKGREGKMFRKLLWHLVGLRVHAHGDPRPRVDPLSGR